MSFLSDLVKSKISRRLLVYTLLFNSALILVFTTYQLRQVYVDQIESIELRINRMVESNKAAIAKDIWNSNIPAAGLQLQEIQLDQDILCLSIIDNLGQSVFYAGTVPCSSYLYYEFDLDYIDADAKHRVGQLTVIANLGSVYQALWPVALTTILTLGLMALLVSLFVVLIVQHLITRHLDSISNHVTNLVVTETHRPFKLDRNQNYWTQDDELTRFILSLNHMWEELFQARCDIEYQSLHDHLTGLPNRHLLEQRLKHELLQCERTLEFGALLFIDLDNFKLLNDSLGHTAGDQMICNIADSLKSLIGKEDTLARIGGDEFLILLSTLSTNSEYASGEANKLAQKIRRQLNKMVRLGNHQYRITASIGIELFRCDFENFESILKHADIAMHQAKSDGRNAIRKYHHTMQASLDNRLTTEQQLVKAIESQEFDLYFQPQYNGARQIVSAELLVRWIKPNGDVITPGAFINVAEESGLIIPIGEQVLETAFRYVLEDLAIIQQAGLKNLAINVSPRQFNSQEFVETIIKLIDRSGLNSGLFTLELTEDAIVKNIVETTKQMKLLKQHGFSLSLDDFGTGYSSLRYLKEFPLDELKIDQTFINQLCKSDKDRAIVSSIILMAQNLNLNVVAEGVEQEDQLNLLLSNGCDSFQGYLFSKPVSHDEFRKLLEQQIADSVITEDPHPLLD
jgi:diguanylate cyclase (GGDEF)-like protein